MLTYIDYFDPVVGVHFIRDNLVQNYEIFSGLDMQDIIDEYEIHKKESNQCGIVIYTEILFAPYVK